MKRKSFIAAILPMLLVIFAVQSCSKEEGTFKTYGSFSEPTVVAPLNGYLATSTNNSIELKWDTSDPEGDAPISDVYFGTSDKPELFKEGHSGLSITVPVIEGKYYYWMVKMKDANGVMTSSAVFDFSVKVNYDINNFVGVFDCDEPGYAHYDCNLTKIDDSTVENDNFWDSGWAVQYVFDEYGNVNIIPVSYVSGSTTYDITGHGKFNNNDKTFYVDYLVKNHASGATVDSNTHTFVKK